jgi:hypothetical protein
MKHTILSLLILSVFFSACTTDKETTRLTFNGGELLYTDSITATQAKALGEYLTKTGFYDGKPKTVQLDKQDGVIHFGMVLNDSFANSQQYQTMGVAFVDELEQNVFKGSTVELDYCDENMKVKKNIKGNDADKKEAVVNAGDAIEGTWICNNITGGEADAEKQADDLKVLKTNFTFTFNDDLTFKSNFVNQTDVSQPLDMNGNYTIVKDNISFHHLTINGQPAGEKMLFNLAMNDGGFHLISQTDGVKDLIMTFVKTTAS